MNGDLKLTVLYIEDDPDCLFQVKTWLRKAEPESVVVSAPSLEDGRTVLTKQSVDIVMLDLRLPDAIGLKALQALRSEYPRLPVIVVTGLHEPELRREAMRLGAEDFLSKDDLNESVLARTLLHAMERLRNKAALQVSHQRFQTLFQAAPAGLVLLDLNRTILQGNDTLKNRLHVSKDAFEGCDFLEFVAADSISDVEVFLDKLHDTAEPKQCQRDVLLRGPSGNEEWCVLKGLTVSSISQPEMLVSLEFLGERRQWEAKLRDRQKMEAVGRLAGGLSHAFNNILTSILSHAQLLEQELDQGSPLLSEIEGIKACSAQASRLTRQLLTFSQRQAVQPRPLAVCEVISGVFEALQKMMGTNIEVTLNLSTPDLIVEADVGQFEQLILNLALNAKEAMTEGSKFSIRVERVDPDTRDERPYVRILVEDTGKGMDEETMARAFEPFFTTKQEHSGLGLSTAFGIVQSLGGRITFDSVIGEGTSVAVDLPLSDERPHSSPSSTSHLGRLHLLLVEDDPSIRRLIPRYLRKKSWTVWEAGDAEEARELLAEHAGQVDIVVTDVVMPGESGHHFAKWLEEQYPSLPVILISGYSPDTEMRAWIESGQVHFLAKPFAPSELYELVGEVLA